MTYTNLAFLVSMMQTPLINALTRFEQSSMCGRDEKNWVILWMMRFTKDNKLLRVNEIGLSKKAEPKLVRSRTEVLQTAYRCVD
jgi:hypothetical protein